LAAPRISAATATLEASFGRKLRTLRRIMNSWRAAAGLTAQGGNSPTPRFYITVHETFERAARASP
jgi:hypothetical protein